MVKTGLVSKLVSNLVKLFCSLLLFSVVELIMKILIIVYFIKVNTKNRLM